MATLLSSQLSYLLSPVYSEILLIRGIQLSTCKFERFQCLRCPLPHQPTSHYTGKFPQSLGANFQINWGLQWTGKPLKLEQSLVVC